MARYAWKHWGPRSNHWTPSTHGVRQVACARMRDVCPVRPSPIVVYYFLLHDHKAKGEDCIRYNQDPSAHEARSCERVGIEEQGRVDNNHHTGAEPTRDSVLERFTEPCTSSSLLTSMLPFHDEESLGALVIKILRASERLAREVPPSDAC